MNKGTIKVIKRTDREVKSKLSSDSRRNREKSAKVAAREMVATVTSWVNEIQQKRKDETSEAIKNLFAEPAA
jgi:uncharacterized membrane-anchored protein